MKTPHLTAKQIELVRVIGAANPDGAPIDLDQILERIRYETTKASLHFSLRVLVERGLIVKGGTEKRRGAQRRLIHATAAGKAVAGKPVGSAPAANPVVELGFDEAEILDEVPETIVPDIVIDTES